MRARSTSLTWLLVVANAVAFVVGVSAQQVVATVTQAVVTPDNPIFGAQDPAPETPAAPPQEAAAPTPPAGRGGRGNGQPRPYRSVITNEAKTDVGVFTVHRVGETVYYEIPKSELGKDFLWVTQIKRTTLGSGYGGQAVDSRVVRWEQNGNRVFVKLINYDVVADAKTPMARAVADANNPGILRTFNVEAVSPSGSPVINVTTLFLQDIAELSVRRTLGARGMDPTRSFVEKIVSFPENINTQVTQTFTGSPDGPAGAVRGGMAVSTGTVLSFHSMVKLPEQPMTPRLADSRVGYFTTSNVDFGRNENKAVERTFITRFRLEKKDPERAVSDPVKPIVFYVDPATPAKFVPSVMRGVEDWRPAFEAAGFSNAIIAKVAPTVDQDPDWDPEDVRYSVIRWLPSTVENAMGPHVADPRSGEILESDIQFFHNVQNLATMWYFVQVGALDPRAHKLPLPDDLMGRLVQQIVAHEVGHTLGLRHNMKASSLYSLEQVRDKNWVRENGHTPTLMDYSRYNYVAQPEDGIAIDDLIPKIGPYDKWAISWGYKPVPGMLSPDSERPTLDLWAREQDEKPYLRFTTAGEAENAPTPFDPGQVREAVGDADAVRATTLGLKNLERVAALMIPATSRAAEPYDDLTEVYGRLVGQWRTELGHVVNIVGGMDSRELYNGQPGLRFVPIPRARQETAVKFLLDNAFKAPTFLINTEVLRRIEPSGVVNRVRVAHNSLLNGLLSLARLDRMVEHAAQDRLTYTPLQLLTDLRTGIWRELRTPAVAIDVYRRNTQRAHIETMDNRLNGTAEPTAEVRALIRGELRALDQQIAAALPGVTDVATRRHLQDARDTIAMSLDPRAMRQRAGPGGGRGGAPAFRGSSVSLASTDRYDYDNDPFLAPPMDCWLDLSIR